MFSGDAFHDDKALSELEGYLGRWQREAEATRRLIEAQQLEEDQA